MTWTKIDPNDSNTYPPEDELVIIRTVRKLTRTRGALVVPQTVETWSLVRCMSGKEIPEDGITHWHPLPPIYEAEYD